MPKVLEIPGKVRRQRDIWRNQLRKLSQTELKALLEIRFLNDVDVAARRGKTFARMPIAADTFSEFTYGDMRVVDAFIRHLTILLRPTGILVSIDRQEVLVGPAAIVTTDAVASHVLGMKLRDGNLTKVRALLREARRRRDEKAV